ncbi:hypothetical protein Aduo_007988 [Ancylostoma duodenale]
MLDEVDDVTHIEPIGHAIKSFKQKLDHFARSLEERIDSPVQRLEMRMWAYDVFKRGMTQTAASGAPSVVRSIHTSVLY